MPDVMPDAMLGAMSERIPARRIAVLCDNESADPRCGCEWGLSLAVELGPEGSGASAPGAQSDGGLWLWDTGQTALFLQNAKALGVDVARARGLALSHGHYDHTGGLAALMAAGFRGAVHAHPCCAAQRYAKEPHGKPRREIGPPAPLPAFLPVERMARLAPGLTMLADIPRLPGRYQSIADFSLDAAGTTPDPVPDDALLVLETRQGPVVILGCCHSGLANTLACVRQRLGLDSIHAVLGGMHLFNAHAAALDETSAALLEHGVRQVVAGHCTGKNAVLALGERLPQCDVRPLAAGQIWIY